MRAQKIGIKKLTVLAFHLKKSSKISKAQFAIFRCAFRRCFVKCKANFRAMKKFNFIFSGCRKFMRFARRIFWECNFTASCATRQFPMYFRSKKNFFKMSPKKFTRCFPFLCKFFKANFYRNFLNLLMQKRSAKRCVCGLSFAKSRKFLN